MGKFAFLELIFGVSASTGSPGDGQGLPEQRSIRAHLLVSAPL